ncbi:hypothetical protein JHK85_045732 [Glycine max]|nr:hypothetical protein JHK85_045732 [Glycine max]
MKVQAEGGGLFRYESAANMLEGGGKTLILNPMELEEIGFKINSIGALDGIHIPVTVTAEDRPRYRNRKGDISTNVLGACGPNLRFIYVLPGWEGSAGDSRSHEETKQFRFKVIPNWNDIVDLCAKDRATGLGAENALDADDIMSKETNEEETIHTMEIKEAQEVVHEVVSELDNIPNFNGALRHRAIDWLTENPIKFAIIKALPLDEKEDYISSFMP